jgi:hypothetical protein
MAIIAIFILCVNPTALSDKKKMGVFFSSTAADKKNRTKYKTNVAL